MLKRPKSDILHVPLPTVTLEGVKVPTGTTTTT